MVCQTACSALSVPTHHVVVIVEISVTNEAPCIRIIGRFDKGTVDFDHKTRAPQLPQSQNVRKVQIKATRSPASIVKSGPANFQRSTH